MADRTCLAGYTGDALVTIAIDRATGRILWERAMGASPIIVGDTVPLRDYSTLRDGEGFGAGGRR